MGASCVAGMVVSSWHLRPSRMTVDHGRSRSCLTPPGKYRNFFFWDVVLSFDGQRLCSLKSRFPLYYLKLVKNVWHRTP